MVLNKRDTHDLGHDLYYIAASSFHGVFILKLVMYCMIYAFFLPKSSPQILHSYAQSPKSDDRNAATKPAKRQSSFGKIVLMLVNQ